MMAGMEKGDVAGNCISARLMKLRVQLNLKSKGVSLL